MVTNPNFLFEEVVKHADAAGREAVEKLRVVPMIVGQAKGLFSNEIIPGTEEYVADGVCGFAWVNVKPGTSKFARWLKSTGQARPDSYYGGVTIWISDFNQSMQKKEAYARAYAKVLVENGIKAYAASRLD